MSLYEEYVPGVDKIFESMKEIMSEEEFYEKMKNKFDAIEKEISGLSSPKAQKYLSDSIIRGVQKVHDRILLTRDLTAKVKNADNNTQVYMYPGLITYLYLTCFDNSPL